MKEDEKRDEVLCGPDFGDDEPCGWGQILFMTGCAGNRAERKRGGSDLRWFVLFYIRAWCLGLSVEEMCIRR